MAAKKPSNTTSLTNNAGGRKRRWLAPVILLFFVSPLFGEYLLGNLKFSEIYLLPFLGLLYGAGALLVRETARRMDGGYGTMLGLGLAYALIEEGLVTQLLFNQDYFAGQQELATTMIPFLGMDAWLTLIVVAMHIIWSICIPIVLIEMIFRKRGVGPWLGKIGYATVALIFIFGCVWIGYETYLETGFWVPAAYLVGTIAAAAITVIATLALTGRQRKGAGSVPVPWLAGCVALAASSAYMLTEYLPGWVRVLACLAIAIIFFAALYRWSARRGWSAMHSLAVAGGGILTYAWLGAVMIPESGPKLPVDHIGTIIIIAVALALFMRAVRSVRKANT